MISLRLSVLATRGQKVLRPRPGNNATLCDSNTRTKAQLKAFDHMRGATVRKFAKKFDLEGAVGCAVNARNANRVNSTISD